PSLDPVRSEVGAADLLVEAVESPGVETSLDQPESGRERMNQVGGAEDRFQVVVTRAVVGGVGEGGVLLAWHAREVAQPEHALAGKVADRSPERPAVGRRS